MVLSNKRLITRLNEKCAPVPGDFHAVYSLFLCFLLWLIVPGHVFAGVAVDYSMRQQVGYQVDRFDWNISGSPDGSMPNVLSELSWRALDVLHASIGGKVILDNTLYVRGQLGRGVIVSGENQDSDYCNDNRMGVFSTSSNQSRGNLKSEFLGIGLLVDDIGGRNISFIPQIGLSRYYQYLTIFDGQQTAAGICPFLGIYQEPEIGRIEGLDSSYEAVWSGEWYGAELWWELSTKHALMFNMEYHQVDYRAKAKWNLRRDFAQPVSFRHRGRGVGKVLSLTWEYWLTPYQIFYTEVVHQVWRVTNGVDTVFFVNGESSITRLNEVNRDSHRISLGVEFLF